MDLQAATTQAKALDTAQKNSDCYRTHVSAAVEKTILLHSFPDLPSDDNKEESACAALTKSAIFVAYVPIPVQCAPHERRFVANATRKDFTKVFADQKIQSVCRSKDPAVSKSTTALMLSSLLATASRNGVPTIYDILWPIKEPLR